MQFAIISFIVFIKYLLYANYKKKIENYTDFFYDMLKIHLKLIWF